MYKNTLIVLLYCAAMTGNVNALCEDCTAPYPEYPPTHGVSWEEESSEVGDPTAGAVVLDYGEPTPWIPITSCIDNNCGDNCPDGNPAEASYSQTTGMDISRTPATAAS